MLCARCTRFSEQIAGDPFIALIERGALQQVGIYEKEPFESYFSGNTDPDLPGRRPDLGGLPLPLAPVRPDLDAVGLRALRLRVRAAHRPPARQGHPSAGRQRPEVNEEWNCDKGRFAFTSTRAGGPAHPPDGARRRDRRAAAGFLAGGVRRRCPGLGGGAEQPSACWPVAGSPARTPTRTASSPARCSAPTTSTSGPARTPTRRRASSPRTSRPRPASTFADLEHANAVVLSGSSPRRSRRSCSCGCARVSRRHGTRVYSVASHTSRGLEKLHGTLLKATPGRRGGGRSPALADQPRRRPRRWRRDPGRRAGWRRRRAR